MAVFNLALPKITQEELSDDRQARKIMSYLYKLDEQLRFVLNNLDEENFTERFQVDIEAATGKKEGMLSTAEIESEIGRLSTQIAQTAQQISLKASAKDLTALSETVSEISAEADGIRLSVERIESGETPAGSVKAGSSVTISEDEVRLSAKKTVIAIPGETEETTVAQFDGDGLRASSVTAPDVAPRYRGKTNLYVNPAATGTQIAAGTHFRSLKDACAAVSGRWVDRSVVIHLAAGMTEYGDISLRGICGGRWVEIRGDESSRAKLVGSLTLAFNACPVYVRHLDIDTMDIGLNIEGTQTATVNHITVTGPGVSVSGTRGILSQRGSSVNLSDCEIYDCERSLYAQIGGTISGSGCRGNCRVGAVRSMMYLSGTQPCDSAEWTVAEYAGKVEYEDVTVDQGTKPTPEAAPTSVSYTATGTDSYAGGGWNYYRDSDIRQGYANGPGEIRGCFWFDNAAIRAALKGKTVKQASLSLYQMPGYGRDAAVSVSLEGIVIEYEGRSGVPYGNPEYGVIGSTAVGETAEFTLPVKVINDLVGGTINGLMVRTGEKATMDGRDFSANYARFAGLTEGSNLPRLTVAYG